MYTHNIPNESFHKSFKKRKFVAFTEPYNIYTDYH